MDLFFIRIPEDLAGDFTWLLYKAGHKAGSAHQVQQGAFEEAANAAKGHQVILLVPGEQVVLRSVDIPAKRSSKLLKAVPYALEEDLATDIDDLHFAIGQQENNITPVASVEQRLIEGWTGLCKAHDIQLRAIIPDTLSLPLEANSWSVLIEPNQAIVRTGIYSGFNCHPAMLDALLAAKVSEDSVSTVDKINLWLCNNEAELKIQLEGLEVIPHTCSEGALSTLAQGWKNKQYIDLQQGEFGQTHDIGNKLRPWKWAAILFGLWAMTGFAKMAFEKHHLTVEKAELAGEIETTYRQVFPAAKKIPGQDIMRKRVKSMLRDNGHDSTTAMNLLALLDSSGQTIKNNKDTKLTSVNFKDNLLELNVSANSLSQLDELKTEIAKATGLKTELKSASSSNNKTSAQIRVLKP